MNNIKRFFYNIKNIYGWSKILWNDFDWDYNYLLKIMQYKLSKMKYYFENDTVICDDEAKKVSERISTCLDACNHLVDMDFEYELIHKHYEKYPIRDDYWLEDINKPMTEIQRAEWLEMNRLVEEKTKEYESQLFDTMKEYYRWWWD